MRSPHLVGSIVVLSISHQLFAAEGPLSEHFQDWIERKGYGQHNFSRLDYGVNGSFGGKDYECQNLLHIPVVFVHGNSDTALTTKPPISNGYSHLVEHFLSSGYGYHELYGTSWEDNEPAKAVIRYHSCENVLRLRTFLEAVIEYTGAMMVNIVSHSMGVTLTRKVIKGGLIHDKHNECDVGPSLSDRVHVHVAIAGGNFGLCNCIEYESTPTCDKTNGFWPGNCGSNSQCRSADVSCDRTQQPQYSSFLTNLNNGEPEGEYVFSVWSEQDNLIQGGGLTWGRQTSLIPNSNGYLVYKNLSHNELRDNTAEDVFYMVSQKNIPPRFLVKEEL